MEKSFCKCWFVFILFTGFPSQPKHFEVKSKSNGSVTLQWKSPDLKDLNAQMIQYVFMCDRANFTQGMWYRCGIEFSLSAFLLKIRIKLFHSIKSFGTSINFDYKNYNQFF